MAAVFVFALILSINVAVVRRAYRLSSKWLVIGYIAGPAAALLWNYYLGLPSISVLAWMAVAAAAGLIATDIAVRRLTPEEL